MGRIYYNHPGNTIAFGKGDKVSLKGRSEVTGTIIDARHANVGIGVQEYKVKHDDQNLVPSEDWYYEGYLNLEDTDGFSAAELTKAWIGIDVAREPKCVCGLKFARNGGLHSDWCNVKN